MYVCVRMYACILDGVMGSFELIDTFFYLLPISDLLVGAYESGTAVLFRYNII